MSGVIDRTVVDGIIKELEIEDFATASIRQVGAIVRTIEERTGT